jgi:hypothetical protein
MVVHICNPNTQEVDAGRFPIGGQFRLHGEFKDSLVCIVRPCLKKIQIDSQLKFLVEQI